MDLYKITNNINGKIYIWISKDHIERWKYHKQRAFQPQHKEYDKPLYRAFRKYWLENFSFELLETGLSEEEAQIRERECIIQYDSWVHNKWYNIKDWWDYFFWTGEQVNTAVLTEEEVFNIRTRRNAWEKLWDVYKDYSHKIQYSGFQRVWRDETWKHYLIEPPKEKIPCGASLNIPMVKKIKQMYHYDNINPHQIAAILGLEYKKVWRICTGQTYTKISID